MKRSIVHPALLIPFCLAALSCAEARPARVEVGAAAPEYAALTLEGDSVRLADLRGRVVLLNVWATWCPPCREEIPALQALHEKFAARGFEVLGVSLDGAGEREQIRRFTAGMQVSYTLWHDPDDRISPLFQLLGMPTTFLIDREGTILWKHMGPVSADDPILNQLVDEALVS